MDFVFNKTTSGINLRDDGDYTKSKEDPSNTKQYVTIVIVLAIVIFSMVMSTIILLNNSDKKYEESQANSLFPDKDISLLRSNTTGLSSQQTHSKEKCQKGKKHRQTRISQNQIGMSQHQSGMVNQHQSGMVNQHQSGMVNTHQSGMINRHQMDINQTRTGMNQSSMSNNQSSMNMNKSHIGNNQQNIGTNKHQTGISQPQIASANQPCMTAHGISSQCPSSSNQPVFVSSRQSILLTMTTSGPFRNLGGLSTSAVVQQVNTPSQQVARIQSAPVTLMQPLVGHVVTCQTPSLIVSPQQVFY